MPNARRLALILSLFATLSCDSDEGSGGMCSGKTLFGRPNAMTGLTDAECMPKCDSCGGTPWVEPDYTAADAAALLDWTLVDPPAELTTDPYMGAPPAENPNAVCAVVHVASGTMDYTVQTFDSEAAAIAAGAMPTHFGACGLCSSLQDLSVYMTQNDLTAPVRSCGIQYYSGPMESHMQCLLALGFTRPCASIWYYNTINTRNVCLDECAAAISAPYNEPDGSLNPCLACDETKSGPVFKAVAGRTRRNTGLANAICRPCDEVKPLDHHYE